VTLVGKVGAISLANGLETVDLMKRNLGRRREAQERAGFCVPRVYMAFSEF
jgi:hypothetical protein